MFPYKAGKSRETEKKQKATKLKKFCQEDSREVYFRIMVNINLILNH